MNIEEETSTVSKDELAKQAREAAGYGVYELDIPAFRAPQALERLRALSKKAVELGQPAFVIDVDEPVMKRVVVEGTRINLRMVPISVIAGPPKLDGWRFVAKIEHDPAGNEVQGFRAQSLVDEDPDLFKFLTSCEPNCAHCNLKRQRNTTFLFDNENTPGTNRIQVGSSCLADFSGHQNPEAILFMASRFADVMDELRDPDEMMSGGRAFRVYETREVWAAAAAMIRVDGRWVSREKATESGSSADWVVAILNDHKTFKQLVEDVDYRVADKIHQWLTDDDFDPGANLYLHNLSVMAHRGYVSPKTAGFAGSAVAAWGRDQMKARQRKGLDKAYESVWLGKHDEKIERTVTVDKIIPMDTMYGTTRLHIMRDSETNGKITWFNSGDRKFFPGDTYKISGRVKELGVRDGQKETQLTRVNSPDTALHKKINDGLDEKALIKKARKIDNINARDGDGESLLHTVSHFYRYRKEGKGLILDLIERGADPSMISNRDGNNAFDYWVDSEDEELIRLGCERFPELAVRWDDKMLTTYGLEDKPWAPWLKEAAAIVTQTAASRAQQNEMKAHPTESGASSSSEKSLNNLRGHGIPKEGERLLLDPETLDESDNPRVLNIDDGDDPSDLKLA